jgi:hydroxymethylglutaryl-CoA reductase
LASSPISFSEKLYNDRLINLIDKKIAPVPDTGKFYKLSIEERRKTLNSMVGNVVEESLLESGGISSFCADKMIENVVGKLALPIGVIPSILINNKKYTVPMAIEEPSVVAATSSIAKFISPQSFISSSSPSIMMGQVHLPSLHPAQLHAIEKFKAQLI